MAATTRASRTRASKTSTRTPPTAAQSSQGGAGLMEIGALGLAMILGAIGFLFSIFWIVALVVMAVLWGTLVADRRRNHGGVVSDVVAAVVDEARGIAESASGSDEPRQTGAATKH